MEESTTYQAIIRKGQLKSARKILLLLGEQRFGVAPPGVPQKIEGMNDLLYLKRLTLHTLDATSWDDLMALPPS